MKRKLQIELHKSKSKKQPFFVRYIGKNNEPLSNSENLTTIENARKNMSAMAEIFSRHTEGDIIFYKDYTLAKPARKKFYIILND